MKKLNVLTRMLLLVALLVGSVSSVWADTYVKVTSAPTDWSGEYVILYESSTTAYVWTGVDANSNYVTTNISNNAITKPDGAVTVTIASMTGGYSIKVNGGNNNGKYISGTKDSNTTNFNDNAVANTLNYNSGVDIASNTSHFVMQFTTSTKRYRYYKSATYSGNNYKRPQLYKFVPTLTYSVDPSASGTISVKNSGNNVNSGSTVASGTTLDIVATPGSGMQFKNWTVTGTGSSVESPTSATTTFTMGSANSTLTANFESALAYTITAIANDDAYGEVNVAGATITATPNSGYKVPTAGGYTVTSGAATVVNNGDGTFTVTPTSDCTVRIDFEEKETPTFLFASSTASATYGSEVTEPVLTVTGTTGAVTYTSDKEAVATVDENTGEVTAVSVGSATITATVAEDANYKTAQASYTLTVNEDATASGASNIETIIDERVSKYTGTGNSSSTITSTNYTSYLDCGPEVWDFSNFSYAYAGSEDESFKFGNSSNGGKIQTQALDFSGDATLTFKVKQWSDSEKSFGVEVSGATATGDTDITASSSLTTKTVNITDAAGAVVIAITSTKRGYVASVKLTQTSDFDYVDVTVPSSGWGTFCSPYPLDFSNAATEVTAYAVRDYNAPAGTVTFEKITGKVPAKTPIVINGEAGAKKIAVTEDETSAPAANKLRGYLSPTYYAGADESETLMGLSGGTFKKMNAGTIPANKAVLVMKTEDFNSIQDASKLTFIFVDDATETDGISNHNVNFVKYDGNAYNLAGQRVGSDYKGVVIVNGKKVVRK